MKDKNPNVHKLCKTDVHPLDKMNVISAKKLCRSNVQDLLPDSAAGTKIYLQIMRDTLDAFENLHFTIEERLEKLSVSIFILRLWRQSIIESKTDDMEMFISLPAYTSLEINFHSFISIIRYCRDNNLEILLHNLFNMSSQICEELFRKFRSLTTLNWTCINFSMADILYKLRRVLALLVADEELSKIEKIILTRRRKTVLYNTVHVPSDSIIAHILKKSENLAKKICKSLNVNVQSQSLKPLIFENIGKTQTSKLNSSQFEVIFMKDEIESNDDEIEGEIKGHEHDLKLMEQYSSSTECSVNYKIIEDKKYFIMKSKCKTKFFKIAKSSFVKLLNDPDYNITNDRKRRFKNTKELPKQSFNSKNFEHRMRLNKSDLIIVRHFSGVARVLGFNYLEKKSKR